MQSDAQQTQQTCTQKNEVIQDLFCRATGGKAYNSSQRVSGGVVLAAGEGSPAPARLMSQQPWPQPETSEALGQEGRSVLFYFLQGFLYENTTSYQHQTVLLS